MRTSTPAAIAASTPCSSGSANRGPDARGRAPRVEVSPDASISARRDRGAVALQPVDPGHGLLLDRVRQLRVLELLRHGLAGALGVVQPVLHETGLRRRQAGL